MSAYLKKGKGWRYDFTVKGERYTEAWFKTKKMALKAEQLKRKEVEESEQLENQSVEIPTDMDFLELVNRRLDDVELRCTRKHYLDVRSYARKWFKRWSGYKCSEISLAMVEAYLNMRARSVSNFTANKDLRWLRATFNWGIKKELIILNPTQKIDFFPVDRKERKAPAQEDIDKVISVAEKDDYLRRNWPDTADYLMVLRDTLARSIEVNRLKWEDVSFERNSVILRTRKKAGGGLTPREVPMTSRLKLRLRKRYEKRDPSIPWVFYNPRTGKPYTVRKRVMRRLCKIAGVPYFRYHPIRHSGASLLADQPEVPLLAIQKLLGHESLKTTETYLHSLDATKVSAIKILERVSQKSHTDSHTAVECPKAKSA